jgi:polyisoprenyl-teichoic acid--peptidoglycan teichoic acid transferase
MKHHLFKFGRLFGRLQPITRPLFKITLVAFALLLLIFSIQKIYQFLAGQGILAKDIFSLTRDPKEFLDNTDDRTNFLVLGLRGEGGEAIDLTDTLIVFSYSYTDQSMSLISIPRDLWVNSLKTKINSVYHYGNLKQDKGGFILTKAAIQETLGLPIHYTTVINFQGFVKTIDLLGGLEINVENSFTDTKYPIPGKENVYPETDRYQTVSFQSGPQTMDGKTALIFVRSRHAEGDEGTDFARSRRQQLVINALRSRLISTNLILDKTKMSELINIVNQNIVTEITPNLYPALTKIALNVKNAPLKRIPLSSEKEDGNIVVLETPPVKFYDNQWVLIARDNNWDALKLYIGNKLKGIQ